MNRTVLSGARTHNLKGVSLELEPGELVAVTGVSGAGKSSLCIDTLYAEGQRRFVESFSPYARQFLERHERPPIDRLEPVPAAVAVDRHAPVKSSRSTVATMADVEPYISALFLREAVPVCPSCSVPARWMDAAKAAAEVGEALGGQRVMVTWPRRVDGTATYLEVRDRLVSSGYRRLIVGGSVLDIDAVRPSDVLKAGGAFDVVIDRLTPGKSERRRLQEALETAWQSSDGRAAVTTDAGQRREVGRGLVCPSCARSFKPARAGLFSYQSPVGACPECRGFGRVIGLDLRKLIPDSSKSLADGALRAWTGKSSTWERRSLVRYCARVGIRMDVAWIALTAEQQSAVIEGEGTWTKGKYPGVRAWFKWLESRAYKMHVRVFLSRYRSYDPCPACNGKRLNPLALQYQVAGLDLASWHGLELREARSLLHGLEAADPQGEIVRRELESRLGFLCDVGLGYLTLDRQARTLSGGEAQRVSLTAALGASLSGALVVLDEPTVGLHPTDVPPLISAMRSLADRGNSVLVVEHDPAVIRATDRVIELGPGAGAKGGELLFSGTPEALALRDDLPTARALAADASPRTPIRRARPSAWLDVRGARANNLRSIDVRLPLGVVCALTGPSGSGKSTLAEEVLHRALAAHFGEADTEATGAHDRIDGLESLLGVVLVDQAPLGRTSRGNPATYTKAWDRIRALFSAERAAIDAGFGPSHFSFNVDAGRCDACSGEGCETVEMQFLADVSLLCPVCRGRRFKSEVIAVQHRGKSVADVLGMTADDVLEWLRDEPAIVRSLGPLQRLGLGYLTLGQPLSTLSGGEAQRLKLARALRSSVDRQLFILDEPSAGLHFADVEFVIDAMRNLVDRGASVIVVEHDLSIIRAADWVVDLGPGAGREGGLIVANGTPEQVAKGSGRTAQALRGDIAAPPRKLDRDRHVNLDAPIRIKHAREHNLRDVSCEVPRNSLVVVTGPSGSGKSTLVFDVMFAEGQRRFLETLTPYARQYLPTMPRPDVDAIEGLPPSIALEQRRSRSGGNSTVATVTEVAHYLRLLFAKVGTPYCPKCDLEIASHSVDGVLAKMRGLRGKGTLFSPAVQARKGVYLDLFNDAARAGIRQARVDCEMIETDTPPRLRKTKEHDIDLLIWEGSLSKVPRDRLETALTWARGAVRVVREGHDDLLLSTARACPRCGLGIPELDPRWFSFNTKQGRCPTCEGTGLECAESTEPCKTCGGSRLAPIPRSVRLKGRRYHEVVGQSVSVAHNDLRSWTFAGDEALIATGALAELKRRVDFLDDVGLGYLGLDRDAATLSGGEMQRLRLSAQLGAGLTGALYVLDEPTIGLHPRDTFRLLRNLRALVDTGSTVVVVEHDADTIRAADHIVDMGPGGGHHGGRIVVQGTAAEVLASEQSPTGQALRDHQIVRAPERGVPDSFITLRGARAHNLHEVDASFPIGRLTVVAGVSGSGKSTLVQKILFPAVRRALGLATETPLAHDSLDGAVLVSRAVAVDQLPIGRTSRSVPATFLGIWDDIRQLFASLPEAKVRGLKPARFSFNSNAGGRCSACVGQGVTSHEMSFLPDVVAVCEACGGARFEQATLEICWKGLSIGDVLRLNADEAAELFEAHPAIARPLRTLSELGVGYLQLGQGSHTLSGGEAQRLKLALELTATSHHKSTLYVLDEPTTGLHLSDAARLVRVLHKLVDRGDTLVVIEHHPDVIAAADYVIELGPEGGAGGGRVIAEGTPAQIVAIGTATGQAIESLVGKRRRSRASPATTDTP